MTITPGKPSAYLFLADIKGAQGQQVQYVGRIVDYALSTGFEGALTSATIIGPVHPDYQAQSPKT